MYNMRPVLLLVVRYWLIGALHNIMLPTPSSHSISLPGRQTSTPGFGINSGRSGFPMFMILFMGLLAVLKQLYG